MNRQRRWDSWLGTGKPIRMWTHRTLNKPDPEVQFLASLTVHVFSTTAPDWLVCTVGRSRLVAVSEPAHTVNVAGSKNGTSPVS